MCPTAEQFAKLDASGPTALLNVLLKETYDVDRVLEQIAPIYATTQDLAVNICDTVEFFYRHYKVPGNFREKRRRWGVVYVFEPNEPQDPAAPIAPTPPATPSPPTQ